MNLNCAGMAQSTELATLPSEINYEIDSTKNQHHKKSLPQVNVEQNNQEYSVVHVIMPFITLQQNLL